MIKVESADGRLVEGVGRDAPRRRGASAVGTVAIMAVTAAIILTVAYLSDRRDASSSEGAVTAVTVSGAATGAPPTVGSTAPDFEARTPDGTLVRLGGFVGHPVWLTFGASWCQPCRAENPDIQAIQSRLGPDLTVIQVYMSEDAAAVTDYTKRVGISYLTVPDPTERLAAQYRILGIPSHFFIDASGILRQIKIGSLDPASMEAAVTGIRE
ncbi:MAG TPA: TlpA disulfide reductase family protein [Candidatus Limnocylindrales bacterium]